jgi:hypothetical protein
MRNLFRILIAVILFYPLVLRAQGVTSASISGVVTDAKGEPIPGATIQVTHLPSGTKYGTSGQLDGRFYIRGLRVGGPYKIVVSEIGYEPKTIEGVELSLGQNLELNVQLSEQAIKVGGVEVVAEQNLLENTNRTGAATSVSKQYIESFPTIQRSFQDFQNLSPQFVGNSALGQNNHFNNIQIDGANYNDLFGLPSSGTPGGQAGTTPISLDAIQEFQVSLAPFDVRQGGFTGAEVNAITRSGTNNYTGSLYFFGQNQNFVGKNYLGVPYTTFSNVQTGFRVGGPIMRDKLFFFVNGEITRRRQPLYDQLNPPSSALNRIDSILTYVYHFANIGTKDPYTLLTPSNKVFVRLDYNISETEKLTIRDNYVDASTDNLVRNSQTLYLSSSEYTFQDKTNSILAQLSSTFSSSLSNELILGYTAIRDNRVIPGAHTPMLQIQDPSIPNNGSIYVGSEEFSGQNALNQDIFEITDNLSWVYERHLFTFGTHDEFFRFNNLFIRDFYGWYKFSSIQNLLNGAPSEYRYSYANTSVTGTNTPSAKWSAARYGVYAQDEWTATPDLKLTLGLRLDIPTFPDHPYDNPTFDSTFAFMGLKTSQVPKTAVQFSPRFGFNWNVMGNRLTIVRGGAGLFEGGLAYVWLSNQYSNTGMDILRIDQFTGLGDGFFQPDPTKQPTPGTNPQLSPIKTTEIDLTSPDFKMPQVFRADVAVDRELAFGIVGTLEGIYTKSINAIMYQDIDLLPVNGPDTLIGLGGRPLYGTPPSGSGKTGWTVNKRSQAYTNVIYMSNTSQPYSYSLTAQLQRQFGDGIFKLLNAGINDQLFLTAAYTFGHSYDQNGILSSQAISQWRYNPVPGDPNNPPLAVSDWDVPNRILVSISERVEYAGGFATTLSIYYNGQNGSHYSYVYNGDVNGDGQTSNDLVYVPKNASDIILTTNNYAALNAFINNDSYLSSHRGQIVPRNGGTAPWQNTVNLRLAEDIPTISGQSIELTLDIFNVLNLLNSKWGAIKYVPNGTYSLLTFKGMNAQGQPTFAFTPPASGSIFQNSDLLSRWQLQLGARYTF